NVVSPSTQGPTYPNMGNVVSPSTQGPTYPNMGNVVSPSTQSPAYPNMGNVASPSTQGPTYPNMGGPVSPAQQSINPYYPTQTGANQNYPQKKGGSYPKLQPWKGKQPQYPIGTKSVPLDQPYTGASKGGKHPSIVSPQKGAYGKTQGSQTAPAYTGKLSPVGTGSYGMPPYPYTPVNSKKPCNCGGPVSNYGNAPIAGYYAGNQPPHQKPIPYSALSNPKAPTYQPLKQEGKSKK
ncbi:hypothetical protein, partial [Sporolactobacillus terrae]|uniref:hypothetical protein n=1 Tax=Sporolactobacillus terrae TaxID=269673 RepID=UPI001C3F3E48